MKLTIEKVENGYLISDEWTWNKKIFNNFEEVLSHIMLVMTGKHEKFKGESYAKITISYKES